VKEALRCSNQQWKKIRNAKDNSRNFFKRKELKRLSIFLLRTWLHRGALASISSYVELQKVEVPPPGELGAVDRRLKLVVDRSGLGTLGL
jgi:hypothetical protein